MKFIFTFLTLFFISNSYADTLVPISDSIMVRSTVDMLFKGMRDGDSSLVGNVFHDDVRMFSTYTTKEGEKRLHEGSLQEFMDAVGTPHEEVWDERISNIVIQIDGNLAQVWMDYSFYLDDTLSHCGVNAMQLINLDEGWKIVHLADTRRRSDCH